MCNFKIAADSSCDLYMIDGVPFSTAPMKVLTAEREFIDDENLDVTEMTEFLDAYKGKSKSSCPNTSDWLEAFDGGDGVFCITITSSLSGSYNSACTAKQICESENPEKRVFVIDSLSAGPEITLAIWKLKEYIDSGLPYEEICEKITAYTQNTGLVFMLKSLKTFANNGRVSPIVAKLAGIAGICIVGKASDEGTLEPLHKCRGEKSSLENMIASLESEGYSGGKVSIGHADNESAALKLCSMINEKYPEADIEIHGFRGLCSFYAEKGGVLIGFEKS